MLVCVTHSVILDSVTPWTVSCLSMKFSREEYWRGLPFPSPVDLPDLGIYPESPALKADSLPSEPPGKLISIKPLKIKCSKRINIKGKSTVFEYNTKISVIHSIRNKLNRYA